MLSKVCNLVGIKSRSADETQLPNENVGSFQSISDWAFIIILNYYNCCCKARHFSCKYGRCGVNVFKNIWSPLTHFNHFPALVLRHFFKTLSHPGFVCEETDKKQFVAYSSVVWCLVSLQDVIVQVVGLSLLHCVYSLKKAQWILAAGSPLCCVSAVLFPNWQYQDQIDQKKENNFSVMPHLHSIWGGFNALSIGKNLWLNVWCQILQIFLLWKLFS